MTPSISPIARVLAALAVALVSVGIGAQAAIGGAGGGGGGGGDTEKLGKTDNTPRPQCPAKDPLPSNPTAKDLCSVTGQVTGYQRSADGEKGLFKVPADGDIVAWSVDLSKPSKEEKRTFGEAAATNEWGEAPTAGISIIRRQDGKNYRLKSKSPILPMRGFYGEKPVITLEVPLPVKQGDIVALTTVTWLPAFSAIDQTESDVWIGSRQEEDWEGGSECRIPDDVPDEDQIEYFFDHSAPHRNVGSEKAYECKYDEARLLYWAYFVES